MAVFSLQQKVAIYSFIETLGLFFIVIGNIVFIDTVNDKQF